MPLFGEKPCQPVTVSKITVGILEDKLAEYEALLASPKVAGCSDLTGVLKATMDYLKRDLEVLRKITY